ncbi:hypothetical protein PV327_011379, partial [Microctonus hyperodae]
MLQIVLLGCGAGREDSKNYFDFYQRRLLQLRMNRGEQETLFRQSRQLTRIVPSREDLVLSVLKAPINQQQQQQQQQPFRHSNYPLSPQQEHHVNCQTHQVHKGCTHP